MSIPDHTSHQTPRITAGNTTKIDPKAKVVSQFATNPLTNFADWADGRPTTPEIDVEAARDFDRENQK